MMHVSGDTIAAIATPQGRGGIGVIRISGEAVPALLTPLLGKIPEPRYASFGGFSISMAKRSIKASPFIFQRHIPLPANTSLSFMPTAVPWSLISSWND